MFKRVLIKTLKNVINNLEDENANLRLKIKQRDSMIKTLLSSSEENKAKVMDLENNIEFLVNNLTPKKKELVRPSNQN